MSKYDVFFKTKKLSINWIFLLIIINFFLHIFYIKSVYASEISYLDANFYFGGNVEKNMNISKR